MLNVNAKAFVPPGAGDNTSTWGFNNNTTNNNNNEGGLYRYRVDVNAEKKVNNSLSGNSLGTVSSLLASKQLFAVRGALDETTLRIFVDESLASAVNYAVKEDNSSGFLLSRSLLALYADVNLINSLNDAKGYLIHLDVTSEFGANPSGLVSVAWESFYELFGQNFDCIALGYTKSAIGLNRSEACGGYRHYFFMATRTKLETGSAEEKVLIENISSSIRCLQISPVSSIVPFTCSPSIPLSIFITVGDGPITATSLDMSCDFSFEMGFVSSDPYRTWSNFEEFRSFFFATINGQCKWERTHMMHLHICTTSPEETNFPIWHILRSIGMMCDDTATSICGVSFDATNETVKYNELIARNATSPFSEKASLEEMVQENNSLDINRVVANNIPQHICSELRGMHFSRGMELFKDFLNPEVKSLYKEELLSRMTFATAADNFATEQFFVRRNTVGSNVLIGYDRDGFKFIFDVDSQHFFALHRDCHGSGSIPIRNSVFKATLTSSFRGFQEYRIIIEDVLIFNGSSVRTLPFSERWRILNNLEINEEDSWPHATPSRVVMLKAGYVPFDKTEMLTSFISTDHSTLGMVFVSDKPLDDQTIYRWVPPSALTVCFSVRQLEDAPEGNNDLKRAFLSVKDASGELLPYQNEYTDFLGEAYPLIAEGCVIECILQREVDGAHWWDLVRDYRVGTKSVTSFDEVDILVHSPGITQEEMLWLLSAPSFQCERCHKVNDAGKRNPRHNEYWCKNCWRETGHGDCIYCGRIFALGMLDGPSQLFYCEGCWNSFSSTNSLAEVGYHVPPPPQATFTQQVTTRCISLLVDQIQSSCPTNDVLDLCCGGSVVRKWMRNKTMKYVGIDLKASTVDTVLDTIAGCNSELPPNSIYDVVCADAFSEDFWTQTITKIHPRQFHVITCFAGLHHAFDSEARARHFVGSVANALVPGGVFLGLFIDASFLYSKGRRFSNSILQVDWEDDAVPRIGNRFRVSTEGGPLRDVNVIPIDFLIAVASEYGLKVVLKSCQTLREFIEKDAHWTKVPTADEKEYLCGLRTLAFKKIGTEQLPVDAKTS